MKKVADNKQAVVDTVPKVGDVVWFFDQNRRVYVNHGFSSGAPIWREHWVKMVVCAENKRSIFVGESMGRSKRTDKAQWSNGETPAGYARDEQEIAALRWAKDNVFPIVRRVQNDATPAQLAAIADLLGYQEGEGWEPRPAHLVGTSVKEKA